MKENTKYGSHRFIGNIRIDEIEPWFDFGTAKPWDDPEIPWTLDNKVRREILLSLAKNPKTFEEINNSIKFSPNPLLITNEEYLPRIEYQWTKEVIQNHLLSLEWYNLIHLSGDKYELTFPVIEMENQSNFESIIVEVSEAWIKILNEYKQDVSNSMGFIKKKSEIFSIFIDKLLDRLYISLKEQGFLMDEANLKSLWAEQLRKTKFEDWINQNF